MSYEDLDRPPYDSAALRTALISQGSIWSDVIVTSATASTNADLAAAALHGAAEGTIHTTDHQQAGRGRLDRTWQAPRGSGIAVSVLLRPNGVPDRRWGWLPLLIGLAVVETINSFGVEATLKWPNDVLVDDRKIAGILLERVDTSDGPAAVVGIGINVSLRGDELPTETSTSMVLEHSDVVDRTVILRELLRNVEPLYKAWTAIEGDPAAGVRESYLSRCSTIGRRVTVTLPDGSSLTGEAAGIDEYGRLLVDDRAVSAGDVSHVRAIT